MSDKFSKAFTLYKARNNGNGAASQWNLGSEKDCIFLEMSDQKGKDDNGNASFDWENKICFKLGESDIGEILSVLMGLQQGVGTFDTDTNRHKGLFHQNKKGNAILYFGKDKSGKFGIYLSVKRDQNKKIVKHTISNGEACVLGVLLRRALEVMYKTWD